MSDEELAKDLGPLAALTIGIGTMIGAGIFVLPGPAVERAGSLVGAAFVIGGLVAILTAFAVAELGTAMPKSGGMYYYINHSLGPLFGSIAGWGNWLGLAFASAFYMVGFGAYVSEFLALPTIDLFVITFESAQVWGLLGAALFVTVNYVGAKETGRLQNIIVISLLGILTLFTVVGIWNADLGSLTPIEAEWYNELLPVTAIVFVSYLGFGQIASVGEEIKNPGRNLPLAIIGSVVFVTILYGLLMVVMLAAVEVELVAGNETAAVDAMQVMMEPFGLASVGGAIVLFGALLATASSANASILASSRINFAMGRDRIVTEELNAIHERFSTPYRSIALTGALILGFIAYGDVEMLATAGSVLHLIIFALINAGLIVMREANPPEYQPDFRVPLYPITPIVGAIASIALIRFMSGTVIALSIGFVVGAALWYLLYARKHVTKQGILGQYVQGRADELPDAAVDAVDSVEPDHANPTGVKTAGPDVTGDEFRVMVPLANPRTEEELLTLAGAIAKQRGGTIHAVHIVQVPDQTPLARGAAQIDRIDAESEKLLARARENAETFGAPLETHTILSHRSFEEIFDAARTFEADQVVMGWGPHAHGRVESRVDELTHNLPCDFLVLKDRGFDPSRILLPTAGGPDSVLGADVVRLLKSEFDSEVTLLHAVGEDETEAEAEAFLEEWAAENGLEDAERVVDDRSVDTSIAAAAEDATLLVIGATERGLLSRLLDEALVMSVLDDVECSVLLAEKQRKRSLRERLTGLTR